MLSICSAIRSAAFRQVNVTFRNSEGETIRRAITEKTLSGIKSEIERISFGNPQHGSDIIQEGYMPVTTEFSIGYVVVPGGGAFSFKGVSKLAGKPHPHFDLVDLAAKTTEDNCIFKLLQKSTDCQG